MAENEGQVKISVSDIELVIVVYGGHHIEYKPKSNMVKYRNVISPAEGGLNFPRSFFRKRRAHIREEQSVKARRHIDELIRNEKLHSELHPLPAGATMNAYMKLQTKGTHLVLYYTDTFENEDGCEIIISETAPDFLALFQILEGCCSFPGRELITEPKTQVSNTMWKRIESRFRKRKSE